MVGVYGRRDADHATAPFRKNADDEYGRAFFSVAYKDSRLFEGLAIWQEEKYRKLQGTYPVISISFANVKERTYEQARKKSVK